MKKIFRDLAISLIVATITYFGFMHNIGFLQVLIGILYGIMLVVLPIVLVFSFGDFKEAREYRNKIKDEYTRYSLLNSIIVIPTIYWILYTSQSYNFLACYILLVLMAIVVRIKTKSIIKNR